MIGCKTFQQFERAWHAVVLSGLVFWSFGSPTLAQCANEVKRIADPVGGVGFQFGKSVAASGDRIVVGAFPDEVLGGAAVFHRGATGNWALQARLFPDDPTDPGDFGRSVDIDQDCVVVGAWADGGTALGDGRAYVFEWNGTAWERVQVLADSEARSAVFGISVAVSQGAIAVGASGGGILYSGRVFIYRRTNDVWELEQALSAPFPAVNDSFGSSVALCANVLAVANVFSEENGLAHIYRWTGAEWFHEAQFDQTSGLNAFVIETDSNVLLAGEAIYRHVDGSWPLDGLVASGSGGAIFQNLAVIGQSMDDDAEPNAGAALVYHHDGTSWSEIEKTYASDADMNAQFGHAIAIDGTTAFISALFGDGVVNSSGVVYEFDLSDCLPAEPCPADCNDDKAINIFDFLCFQGLVTNGDTAADCNADSQINIFDFLCFQGLVTEGC